MSPLKKILNTTDTKGTKGKVLHLSYVVYFVPFVFKTLFAVESQIFNHQLIVPLLFRETITLFSFINHQSAISNQQPAINNQQLAIKNQQSKILNNSGYNRFPVAYFTRYQVEFASSLQILHEKSFMWMSSKPQQENRATQKPSPFVHLISATVALLILVSAVIYSDRHASSLEDKYVHALAPLELPQTYLGIVLQQAAFRQADLLPVYGSSEMLGGDIPYGASDFFATYPTGFNVIAIAKGGNTSLNIAQDLAAIGPALNGRKVVISFTPIIFTFPQVTDYAYDGNFSRLHAASLAFSPTLGMAVKQLAAKRMLAYPDILSKSGDPVLSFALRNLAGGTLYNHILYDLTLPLGLLDTLILRLQDHYEVWRILQGQPNIDQATQRQIRPIDWDAEIGKAAASQKAIANNNPFGIESTTWIEQYHQVLNVNQPGSGDQKYISRINNSAEWDDLAILLEILKELGAQPLIMSRPINGPLSTAAGVSELGRQAFYAKLQSLVGAYNMPLVDFQQYTDDPFFSIDESSHPSQEGWVIVDKTLDAFYHRH